MSKLTIREIAKMAGVSPTAVSFVLNNREGVSEETRKKVSEVIERTNFEPSVNSRRLFFKKSYNVSIVIKDTSSPFDNLFYFEIAKGLLSRSKEYGYNIVFADISSKENTSALPDIVKLNDTDGIIFLQDTERVILNDIEKKKIPFVVIDAHTPDAPYTCVTADYLVSAYTSTKYLIDNGHRDIAFIGSSFIPDFYLQSFEGYKKALEEAGISIHPQWLQIDAADEVSSYRCMERIIRSGNIPTAVFCSGDIFAIGAMNCAGAMHYKVPQDISFTAIDDIVLSRYFEPKLTTARIDMFQMGTIAMELIMKKVNGEQVQSVIVKSDDLIVRDSVCNRNP